MDSVQTSTPANNTITISTDSISGKPIVPNPQVETPNQQSKTEQSADQVEKKEPVSPHLAALIKRHQQVYKIKEETKALRDQAAKIKAEADLNLQKFEEAKKSPLSALQAAGYTYEDATNFLLNNGNMTPEMQVQQVRKEIENLKQETKAKEEREAAQRNQYANQQMNQIIDGYRNQINQHVNQNPEKYEAIKFEEAEELVLDTVWQNYDRTNKIMPLEQAAQLVEDYLEDRYTKAAQLKRIQTRMQPKQVQNKQEQPMKITQSGNRSDIREMIPTTSKTLSNQMTSSMPSMVSPKTDSDRIARALAALEKSK